jgi:hypothetical protein
MHIPESPHFFEKSKKFYEIFDKNGTFRWMNDTAMIYFDYVPH